MASDNNELREQAERAWIEYVKPLKQKLFFESEREQWITQWIQDHTNG